MHKLVPKMLDSDEAVAHARPPADSQRTAVQHTPGQLDDDEDTAYSPTFSVYEETFTAKSLPDPEYFAWRLGLTMEELGVSDDDNGDSLEVSLPDPSIFEISDEELDESIFPSKTINNDEDTLPEVPTTTRVGGLVHHFVKGVANTVCLNRSHTARTQITTKST